MSGQYCVDANVFITAWQVSYPIHIFAPLWERLAQIKGDIILIEPVFNEIDPMSPSDRQLPEEEKRQKHPLHYWMITNQFIPININGDVNAASLSLEREYEITEISKGASKCDITQIAYAKIANKSIVTLEKIQMQPPSKKYNYQIPLICKEQEVECITFIAMLDRLGVRL
jgi:hypothetical protein